MIGGDSATPEDLDRIFDDLDQLFLEEARFAFDDDWGLRLQAEFFGPCGWCCDGRECGCYGACILHGHQSQIPDLGPGCLEHLSLEDVSYRWSMLAEHEGTHAR